MVGIVSYGTYIPRYRIKIEDIARVWGKDPAEVKGSLGVTEKSVPELDEDAVTIAIESATRCFAAWTGKPSDIGALFVGSESHPYAVNPSSTIVGELLGVGRNYLAADLEFACKAATAGMQAIAGLLGSGHISCGLAIGADTAQGSPHDVLEYTTGSGGVAFLLGTKNVAAELLAFSSYSSDTPDFWRRDGVRYPTHAGRFTGEPAYFAHVLGASNYLMEKAHIKPSDATYSVFHMPNGRFPRDVARRIGFTEKQLAPSLVVDRIGNPYSATCLLGLSAVLDIAAPGQTIFMVSYGSGAGCDAFYWKVSEGIQYLQTVRKLQHQLVTGQIDQKVYITYDQYLRKTSKI